MIIEYLQGMTKDPESVRSCRTEATHNDIMNACFALSDQVTPSSMLQWKFYINEAEKEQVFATLNTGDLFPISADEMLKEGNSIVTPHLGRVRISYDIINPTFNSWEEFKAHEIEKRREALARMREMYPDEQWGSGMCSCF